MSSSCTHLHRPGEARTFTRKTDTEIPALQSFILSMTGKR